MVKFSPESIQKQLQSEPMLLLNEAVYKLLLNAIVDLDLLPGDKIIELSLAKDLNVSRTTIRYAIDKLRAQGFLSCNSKKVITVAGIEYQDTMVILHIRNTIEACAVKLMHEAMTEQEARCLVKYTDNIEQAYHAGDSHQISNALLTYHDFLIHCAHSKTLSFTWKSIFPYLQRFLNLYASHIVCNDTLSDLPHQYRIITNSILHMPADAAIAHLNAILAYFLYIPREDFVERVTSLWKSREQS